MANTRVPTKLHTILNMVVNKLIDDEVFGFNSCYLSLTPDPLIAPADDYVGVLTPTDMKVSQPLVVGGGNDLMYFEGEFVLNIWVRLATDRQMQDNLFLTDTAVGAIKKLNDVMRSLQLYDPNIGSNMIMGEPIRLIKIMTGQRTTMTGWGHIATHWELHFTQDLT